jgi:hypothetical protein
MCGTIRYACSAAPVFMVNCHCRDCQQATGTAFAAGLLVPRDAVKIAGDVKYYDVVGGSGSIVGRGFCPNCGAYLFSKPLDLLGNKNRIGRVESFRPLSLYEASK